jgi:hypothetical protein
MMPSELGPRAMGGAPLLGDVLAYNIYVDEAGTSQHEPVRVVCAVIVDLNKKWREAEAALQNAFQAVPVRYRQGFVFHAKSIWGNPKYRDDWPIAERIAFLKSVMRIPYELGIPFSIGKVRSDAPENDHFLETVNTKPWHWQHARAFFNAVERADFYLRYYGEEGEVGTIVAEDIDKAKRFVRGIIKSFQLPENQEYIIMPQYNNETSSVLHELRLTQIIDRVHFVDKGGAPLLQIADGIAFAFRRWLAGEELGDEFVRAVTDEESARKELKWEDWQGPASHVLFRHGLGIPKRKPDLGTLPVIRFGTE